MYTDTAVYKYLTFIQQKRFWKIKFYSYVHIILVQVCKWASIPVCATVIPSKVNIGFT